jgi:hypothetical protein
MVLSGCASGFDRGAMKARMQNEAPPTTDEDIQQVQALKPQLTFPCRIAVYLKPGQGNWRWTPKDKAVMESWGKALVKDGIASDVFLMSDMFVPEGCSLKQLRVAAARHGADALFVIQGTAQSDSWLNPAAVLNLTVVGGFLVPGSCEDALFLMQGGLVDVGNGFLYAAVESEGEGKTLRPTFVSDERGAVEKAKRRAVEQFGPELLRRLHHLRGS